MTALPARRPEESWQVSLTSRFLSALFAAYDDARVRYVVLRNYEGWPASFGNDIDMVVHRDDLGPHEVIVQRLASDFGLYVRVVPRRSGQITYDVLPAHLDGAERGVLLDVSFDLVRRGLVYLPGELVLGSRRRVGRFYVPSPALESVALLLHCVIDKRRVRPSYHRRLCQLVGAANGEMTRVAEPLVGRTLTRHLARALADGTPEAILPLRGRLLRACTRRNPGAFRRWLLARGGAAWDRLWRWVRPPGRMVVLLGPDGAGKTTLAQRVQERFAPTRVPISVLYHGAREPLLPTRRLSRAVHRWLAGPNPPKAVNDVNRRRRLRGLLHILADQTLRYLVQIRPRLVRGELVILDRYFYDYRIFPHPLVVRPWVSALAMRLIPRPALIFYLVGNSAVIAARKRELTAAETARQMQCFEQLRDWLPGVRAVQGDGDLRALVDEVSGEVVRLYAGAYGSRTCIRSEGAGGASHGGSCREDRANPVRRRARLETRTCGGPTATRARHRRSW